jgi:DNA-binding NarL/FixJ family response regulator
LLLVLYRAILYFVALRKTGRTGAETKPFVEPIQSLAAQEAAPVKRVTENSLPENVAREEGRQPSAQSVKEPISAPKPKRSKSRKSKADRTAKLEKALKLLDEGKSRRAIAKAIGVAESTLRAWLKREQVACIPS